MVLKIVTLMLLAYFVSADLQIIGPNSLKSYWVKEKPKTAIANFGYVPWGRKLDGTVHIAEPYKACEPLKAFPISEDKVEQAITYPIVLAERGGCTFTQKAQNAQLAGARMLIIVDTLEEPLDQTMPVGDGHDSSVHIPTVMIGPRHGAKIKEYIEKSSKSDPVTISMKFDMAKNKDSKVKFELWLSGTDERSFQLASGLKKYIDEIGYENAVPKPYYAIWYCPYCREMNYTTQDNENCYSGGRYCSPDPDDNGPLTGRDILKEDLRQLCLADLDIKDWFKYMQNYDHKCPNSSKQMDTCFENAMKGLNYKAEEINACVSSSFQGSNWNLDDNWRLGEQRKIFKRRGIQVWPSVVINSFLYRGNVIPVTNVYEAICEAFDPLPKSCEDYLRHKKSDVIYEEEDDVDLFSIVAWITMIAAFFLLFALFFYRRWIRRELMRDLNNQLNARISEYMAMQDDDKETGKGKIDA